VCIFLAERPAATEQRPSSANGRYLNHPPTHPPTHHHSHCHCSLTARVAHSRYIRALNGQEDYRAQRDAARAQRSAHIQVPDTTAARAGGRPVGRSSASCARTSQGRCVCVCACACACVRDVIMLQRAVSEADKQAALKARFHSSIAHPWLAVDHNDGTVRPTAPARVVIKHSSAMQSPVAPLLRLVRCWLLYRRRCAPSHKRARDCAVAITGVRARGRSAADVRACMSAPAADRARPIRASAAADRSRCRRRRRKLPPAPAVCEHAVDCSHARAPPHPYQTGGLPRCWTVRACRDVSAGDRPRYPVGERLAVLQRARD
jgi:hypothetical protein